MEEVREVKALKKLVKIVIPVLFFPNDRLSSFLMNSLAIQQSRLLVVEQMTSSFEYKWASI